MQMSRQHGINMATKPVSPKCRVPLRFQPTACAAGTKPEKRGKSLLSKSPSGTGDLDDTVKKKKEATEKLPEPSARTDFPLQLPLVTSFLFFLFHQSSSPFYHTFNHHPHTPSSSALAQAQGGRTLLTSPAGEMRHADTLCRRCRSHRRV